MYIHFNKVIMHNFLSFSHAEIDLENRNYCVVRGINNCPEDKALSNGSGKSSWSSAICWALTGKTIQGVSRNLKNKFIEEKSCYVTLYFTVDSNNYIITRYVEPKSDLKVIVNGEDKSGKGIKESEVVLTSYLPDITDSLLGSIIILGQKLPYKFTNYKPSERKAILEKLSKSDFMIEELTNSVKARQAVLNSNLTEVQNRLTADNATLAAKQDELQRLNDKLVEAEKPVDFDTKIEHLRFTIDKQQKLQTKLNEDIKSKNEELNNCQESLHVISEEESKELTSITLNKTDIQCEHVRNKSALESELTTARNKINEINNIKDVCPTCGRPFENVVKPDITPYQEAVKTIQQKLTEELTSFNNKTKVETDKETTIKTTYKIKKDDVNKNILEIKKDLAELHNKPKMDLGDLQSQLANVIAQKNNRDEQIKELKTDIKTCNDSVVKLQDIILYNNNEKQRLESHIDVVNKMKNELSRDFRGFLLSNVIEYISKKAKEYSVQLFGTEDLEFILSGNNIDISYSGKDFENLSGGEQQKVDLIIQFALRNMMINYLGFSSNIIVLDEILDNLDSLGCDSVINFITTKLNDVESIFIVSHHTDYLSIPEDSSITIEKDEHGISTIK